MSSVISSFPPFQSTSTAIPFLSTTAYPSTAATSFTSVTASPTLPGPTSVLLGTSLPRAFVIAVDLQLNGRIEKRQTGTAIFISGNGTVNACSIGDSFVLIGDQLYADGLPILANISLGYAPLIGYSGNDTTGLTGGGFSVSDNTLQWDQVGMTNGQASFCLADSGVVEAVYIQGTQPADCQPVTLSTVPGATCPNFNPIYPSYMVGPSGPQGASGIAGAVGPTGPMGPSGVPGASGAVGQTGQVECCASLRQY